MQVVWELGELDKDAVRRPRMYEGFLPHRVRLVDAYDPKAKPLGNGDGCDKIGHLEGHMMETLSAFSDETIDEVFRVVGNQWCNHFENGTAGKSVLDPPESTRFADTLIEGGATDEDGERVRRINGADGHRNVVEPLDETTETDAQFVSFGHRGVVILRSYHWSPMLSETVSRR